MAGARLERPKKGPEASAPTPGVLDGTLEKDYPNVWAHLYQDRYDDGTPRKTSTLLFFLDEGKCKVCVNDREMNRSFFRAAAGLYDALEAVEEALESGSADWRARRM